MNLTPKTLRIGIGLFFIGLGVATLMNPKVQPTPPKPASPEAVAEAQARAYVELEARENQVELSSAAPAVAAFRHEEVILQWWRSIQGSSNRLSSAAALPLGRILTGTHSPAESLFEGVARSQPLGPHLERTPTEWSGLVHSWQSKGWQLDRLSLRQVSFSPPSATTSARSVIESSFAVTNVLDHRLGVFRGPIVVQWASHPEDGSPVPTHTDVTQLEWLTRTGEVPFNLWYESEFTTAPTISLDPILAGDLDQDGSPEFVLVGARRLLRRTGTDFTEQPLPQIPPSATHAAVLCDLHGKGTLSLLVVGDAGLYVLPGRPAPEFFGTAELLWQPTPVGPAENTRLIKHAQVLTAADIDQDGDLDLFVGQYKVPYQKGQFPTPYYDANDGFPNYLLRNDGSKGFTDISESAGLGSTRHRRIYSASLVPFSGEGTPDLILISDFAGIDLYRNRGNAQFSPETPALGEARHLFGMAHALGDFNRDGLPDVLAVGMDSPTASTLDSLGITRGAEDPRSRHRAEMTVGNRVLFGNRAGGFVTNTWGHPLTRTGWSWGVALFDADNNGETDFYFANGHESFGNPADYERQFWLHDVYIGSSSNDPVADLYFRSALGRRRGDQQSYGGWQDNRWFRGQSDGRFVETGALDGIGTGKTVAMSLRKIWMAMGAWT